jgi:hypothetical protein
VRLRLRLAAWYLVCATLLIGHLAWFVALRRASVNNRRTVLLIGGVALEGLVACLGVLLATTPPDAIRLSRRRSEMLIVAGMLALLLTAVPVTSGVTVRTVLGSIAAIVATIALLWCARRTGKSAWLAALFAWNPLTFVAALGL